VVIGDRIAQFGPGFARPGQRRFQFQRLAGYALVEVRAFQQLHGNEDQTVLGANFINGADVRVVQRRQSAGLPLESRHQVSVAGHLRAQYLDGDVAVQIRVRRPVHLAHAAGAEQFHDGKAAKPLAWGQPVQRAVAGQLQWGFGEKAVQAVMLLEKSIHTSAQFRLAAAGAVEKVTPLIRAQVQSFAKKLLRCFLLVSHRDGLASAAWI